MSQSLFSMILNAIVCVTIGTYLYFRIKHSLRVFGVIEFTRIKKVLIIIASLGICFIAADIWDNPSVVALHFILIMMILDLIVFIYSRIRKKITGKMYVFGDKPTLLRWLYETGLIALIITACMCTYGFINARHFVETDYTVDSEGQLDNKYSILYLSDLHAGNISQDVIDNCIKKLYKRKFDMVVLGGDITDERTTKKETEHIFKMLGGFNTKYGIYYTYGNHDLRNYTHKTAYVDEKSYEALCRKNGIKPFVDKSLVLNDELVILGRRDMGYGSPDFDEIKNSKTDPEAVRMTLEEMITEVNGGKEGYGPASKKDPKYYVSLDHQPEGFNESVYESINLTLAGHTHAGQIFPMGFLSRLFGTYNYGRYVEKSSNRQGRSELLVSSGIAMWGFPFRTEKHSEYNVITVK